MWLLLFKDSQHSWVSSVSSKYMKSEVASNSKSSVYSYIRAFNHVLVISSGVWLLSCFSSINMNFFNELSAIMSVHLLRKRIVYCVA